MSALFAWLLALWARASVLLLLALVLHWPNPLAWLGAHRAMAAREEACDEQVLALGARPSSYARELLELNELLHSPLQPSNAARIAALPMVQRSQMEKRVMNILRDDRRPLRRPVAVALVAMASIATLSVAAAVPQEPEKVKVTVKVAPVAPVVKVQVAPLEAVVALKPAPSAVAPTPSARAQEPACSVDGRGNFEGSVSSRRTDDGEYTIFEQVGIEDGDFVFIKRFGDKTVCMRTHGDVDLDRETGRIAGIGSDGVVRWEVHTGDSAQRLEVRAGDQYTWSN